MRDPRRYRDYLETRPRSFEHDAIELMIRLVRETGCRVHIVHLSDADSLSMLAEARSEGLPITVETCPHYLFFDAESIGEGRTDLKCAPPIRDAENRDRLWQGLADGVIDMIVSDHSPCTIDLKQLESGRFDLAWGGDQFAATRICDCSHRSDSPWVLGRRCGAVDVDRAGSIGGNPARHPSGQSRPPGRRRRRCEMAGGPDAAPASQSADTLPWSDAARSRRRNVRPR